MEKFNSVEQYVKTLPPESKEIVEKIRAIVKKAVPEAVETISYQMPAFKLKGKSLVYFAAWKNHIGFYATPAGNIAFKKELAPYKQAKGSVQFPLNEPIPYDLIEKIALFRKQEIMTNQ